MVVDLVETWSELHAAAPRPAVLMLLSNSRKLMTSYDHLYTRPASSSRDLLIPRNGSHFFFRPEKITKMGLNKVASKILVDKFKPLQQTKKASYIKNEDTKHVPVW